MINNQFEISIIGFSKSEYWTSLNICTLETTLKDLEKIITLRNKHMQTNNVAWAKKRNLNKQKKKWKNEKNKNKSLPSSKCVKLIMKECDVAMWRSWFEKSWSHSNWIFNQGAAYCHRNYEKNWWQLLDNNKV
jgi:hypothetical protein